LTWGTTVAFEDSLQFLSGSSEALVARLKKRGKDNIKTLSEGLAGTTAKEGMDMLLRKGVYPYDSMNHVDRFTEGKFNQPKNSLVVCTSGHAARQITSTPSTCGKNSIVKRCVTITILYLKTDVLLLADTFESFRTSTLSSFSIDPAYYIGGIQLSWDCIMKMTPCSLYTAQRSA
jgi:hypothetical protein